MKQEIIKKEEAPVKLLQPNDIAMEILAKGGDLAVLEKLLDMQAKYEANEARKAYHLALSEFKKNPPIISKVKQGYGYKYASWSHIVDKITPELSKHGLSLNHKEFEQFDNGQLKVTCFLTHNLGYSESVSMSGALEKIVSREGKNVMNSLQALGGTVSYLKRYTALALLGLEADDVDNDAQINTEPISEEEQKVIKDGLVELSIDEAKFLKYLQVESVEKIFKTDYQKAINMINSKRKATK